MSTAVHLRLDRSGSEIPGAPRAVAKSVWLDTWPHTVRVLPWMLAGFLAMLWLVPFNQTRLPIPSPVDSLLDRFVVPLIGLVWILTMIVGSRGIRPRWRPSSIDPILVVFVVLALFSVLNNLHVLVPIGEFGLGMKKIWLLMGYATIFFIVGSVVRRSELAAFARLFVVLGTVASIGVIYEFRTGTNVFYDWTRMLMPGAISVGAPPPDPLWGRASVVGPTDHAIAIGTMLAMSLSFALTGLIYATDRLRKVAYAIAVGLMLAACFSTIRKTGFLAPVGALTSLLLLRPRQMLRLLPLGIVLVIAIQFMNPGSISSIKSQFVGGQGFFKNDSVTGRTDDYGPARPDVLNNLALGRGHGTFDPSHYRFLDNEYLGRIIETGVVGLVAFLLLILTVIRVAYRASRCKDPDRARMGVAVVASVSVYLVTNFVYDSMAFPEAPYLFFFLAGLAVVAAPPAKPFRPPVPSPERRAALRSKFQPEASRT